MRDNPFGTKWVICINSDSAQKITMKKWTQILAALAIGLAAVLITIAHNSLNMSNTGAPTEAIPPLAPHQNKSASGNEFYPDSELSPQDTPHDTFETELVTKLQTSYGARIQELNIQASLIKVKEFVLKRYPQDGAERFVRIIQAAFPEYAESILSIIARLEIYNEWLVNNQTMLAERAKREQNGIIWEVRRELFGQDAEIIWSAEQAEMAQKQSAMHALIQQLDQSHDISMEEKLYQLQTAINENYEGSLQELSLSGGMISKAFFHLTSVQQELAQLPTEQRQQKINGIRRQLGLNDELIAQLQTKDEERNRRWENGLAYMAEREKIVAITSEELLPDALAKLREKYFKHEAITIEREEASDFWRFKRPRVYGIN